MLRGAHRIFFQGVIGGGRGQWWGGTMASVEHEPITGVWGQSPSGVQEQSPWSGGHHFGHWMSNGAGKFSPFPKRHLYFYSRCNGNDMGKIMSKSRGVR